MALEDIRNERLKKREGYPEPYPARVKRTHHTSEALANFSKLSARRVAIVGRVMGMRGQGGILFLDVQDASGRMQTLVQKSEVKDFQTFRDAVDIGDFVEITGTAMKTRAGEKSIAAESARIIAKSILPLPSVWHGLKDVEERYRKRYLDLILSEEVRKTFLKRSDIIASLRALLNEECFIEVETPILQPVPGGARAWPFKTHHNALDEDLFLRIAPELYLKRLLVGGFERVFEIGRNFRNEGMDRDHNPEFTMLELYWAYQDYKGLIKFVKKLLQKFVPKKWKWEEVTFTNFFKKHTGKNWEDIAPEKLDEVYKHEIRNKNKVKKMTIVTDYPEAIMPLAKHHKDNPKLTESFQFIAPTDGNPEIVKGFSEMNDPVAQRRQMEEQERAFRAGNEEASRLDEDFLEALEHGMPPAAGMGIGIDRLVAIATGAHAVKDVILFPTMRTKK